MGQDERRRRRAGTAALGLTVTYLGFSQAQPEVSDYRARELRFRALEREITQRAR